MQDRSQPCLPYQGALACELPCVWGGGLVLQMLMPKHSNSSRHTGVPICLLRKALSLSAWATWRAFRTFVLDLSRFKLPLIHHMTTASSLLLKTAKARENMDSTWLTAPPTICVGCSVSTSFLLRPDSQSAHGAAFLLLLLLFCGVWSEQTEAQKALSLNSRLRSGSWKGVIYIFLSLE